VEKWTPVDGDTFLTRENFVLCVFGYEHPERRAISFLKYIPSNLKKLFPMRFLSRKWKLQDLELVRPEKLYTAKNYQTTLQTFSTKIPHYIYFSPFYGKEVVSPPIESVEKVYVPSDCMQKLLQRRKKDQLQELAADLATVLSEESHVPKTELGIRGSIALDMHTIGSDIDLAIYGAENFRSVERAVEKLDSEGALSYIFSTKLDRLRKFKGRYKNTVFMLSAIRRSDEIEHSYGKYRYHPIRQVSFRCHIIDDNEAIFKPAIYKITDYQPLNSTSELADEESPTKVVSMLGCYRNVARKDEKIKVSGMLERVEEIETGETQHQVVVGTGTREDEYIRPIPG
jgi:predicted nucleotidyltransferase